MEISFERFRISLKGAVNKKHAKLTSLFCEILAKKQSLVYTWDITTFVTLTELEYYCEE
jgi:hypothetical protein